MRALILGCVTSLATMSAALANEIYITQAGDGLDLTVVQDGQDNEFGNHTADVVLDGDDTTISLTQTGNSNTVEATIRGVTFTGTWSFTGDNNTVDLLCSSTATGNCETATLNITNTGDDTDYVIYIGETADADSASVAFTVTGDGDAFYTEVDGQSASITITSDTSSSLSTATTALLTPVSIGTSQGGNLFNINVDGDGDIVGHTVAVDITGGGHYVEITQSGIYDNTADLTIVGDDGTIDITQSD